MPMPLAKASALLGPWPVCQLCPPGGAQGAACLRHALHHRSDLPRRRWWCWCNPTAANPTSPLCCALALPLPQVMADKGEVWRQLE